jgi:SAM-dependent methyltransferase
MDGGQGGPAERGTVGGGRGGTAGAPGRTSAGSGPGVITPDGCSVDLYAMLPHAGEADIVHAAIPAGASILELGAGTGRVTGPLTRLGHPVVAVDESPEMLARVRAARTVCARIEDLRLGERFGAVLMASHLINAGEPAVSQFLRTCREHVAPSGCVIVQQHPPEWFAPVETSEATIGQVRCRLKDVTRPGPGQVAATVEYQAGDRVWRQSFTATELTEAGLRAALAQAGLALDGYLTADRIWLKAVPLPAESRQDPL